MPIHGSTTGCLPIGGGRFLMAHQARREECSERKLPMHEYDKSSKWLIQHHGDSILRLAGMRDIVSWQPLPAELVQSRRLS